MKYYSESVIVPKSIKRKKTEIIKEIMKLLKELIFGLEI